MDYDAEFMTRAASGGMLEVEMGKQVAPRAVTPDAKKFAEQMVADHTNAKLMAHEKMTQNADLKAFISNTPPVMQMHLSMAQKGSNMKL